MVEPLAMLSYSYTVVIYHLLLFVFRWLDEGEDDGKIVRELKLQEEYNMDQLEKARVRTPLVLVILGNIP